MRKAAPAMSVAVCIEIFDMQALLNCRKDQMYLLCGEIQFGTHRAIATRATMLLFSFLNSTTILVHCPEELAYTGASDATFRPVRYRSRLHGAWIPDNDEAADDPQLNAVNIDGNAL